ncbi:hypothetical protein GJV07_22730 [Enterobacteriaceae bacterium RIT711]|nr:hypothetical protein [Enterobacteriaceae bacterium RIT711]
MNMPFRTTDSLSVKNNCHDPRCHQVFLQLSNDIYRWQAHINDSGWWLEREKQCLELFQQHGYDLQSGMWYCLISCHRSGWKGITSASLLLANGFVKQQKPCWPPVAASDLRRQILENYCNQILPLIYALPMTAVSMSTLQQMLTVIEQLRSYTVALQSPQQNVLRLLSAWLETNIRMTEQHATLPAVSSVSSTYNSWPIVISSVRRTWRSRCTWAIIGATAAFFSMVLAKGVNDPALLIASNRIWAGNPFFVTWQQHLKDEISMLPEDRTTSQLNIKLSELEQRLLDAEQKRKPYITISELKTEIYQMHEILQKQDTMIENRLNQLQKKIDNDQFGTPGELLSISSQISNINSKYLYLSGKKNNIDEAVIQHGTFFKN